MGQYEKVLWFNKELTEGAGREVGPRERVRYTRTIVLEGTAEWVQHTVARCWLPAMGDFQQTAFGKASCANHKIEVVD